MLIDSHCHLDAHEFGDNAAAIAMQAAESGVSWIVIPAVEVANFDVVPSYLTLSPVVYTRWAFIPFMYRKLKRAILFCYASA